MISRANIISLAPTIYHNTTQVYNMRAHILFDLGTRYKCPNPEIGDKLWPLVLLRSDDNYYYHYTGGQV